MCKISVIIPVYNVAPYLRRSMDCLMNQTMKDLEFICIDDCSTDESLSILREYEAKDSRFKIIASEVNGGAAVARNKGLKVAAGEYLGFIDPDDTIDLNYYEELYKKAKEDDYDIVKCTRKNIATNGSISVGKVSDNIKRQGILRFTSEWTTAIYKSSIIFNNNISFPNEVRKGQDVVFLTNIILNSRNIAVIDNVSYYYWRREKSLNANNLPIDSIKSGCMAFSLIIDAINKSLLYSTSKKTYLKFFERNLHGIFQVFNSKNKTKEARMICAGAIIDNFYKCKEVDELRNIFRHKVFLKYIDKKDIKGLAKCLSKYKGCTDNNKQLSIWKQVFSYKVLTILGLKIKHRPKRYKLEEKLDSMKSAIKQLTKYKEQIDKLRQYTDEQRQQIDKLRQYTDEQGQQINKLKEQTDKKLIKIENDIASIREWCGNFYKDIPDTFPVSLTENEKELLKKHFANSKNYLEFGSGGSTFIALLNSDCNIYSVESDKGWLDFLRSYQFIKSHENGRLKFNCFDIGKTEKWGRPINDEKRDNYPDYSTGIYQDINSKDIDLAFIDGRFRVACVLGVILNCSKDIKILVHDYPEREYYHVIEEFLDIVENVDTLYSFRIKDNVDIERVKQLYEEYKYQYE